MKTHAIFRNVQHRVVLMILLAIPLIAARTAEQAPSQASPANPPRIEAVFVLDTTGSMGGLIEGAKRKIWSIANEMASADPTPEIRIGLILHFWADLVNLVPSPFIVSLFFA